MLNKDRSDDNWLIMKIKQDDISCFNMLYKKYNGKLYNFILLLSSGDTYLSEEIVQNIFIKIWDSRKEIRVEGNVSVFLYTMAKHMFLKVLRRRAQEAAYQEYLKTHFKELENMVESEIEYKLLEEEINRLINQLPYSRRIVYTLSRLKHLTNKEIAHKLNITENTVESQLNKANKFIRKMLSERYNLNLIIFFVVGIIQKLL